MDFRKEAAMLIDSAWRTALAVALVVTLPLVGCGGGSAPANSGGGGTGAVATIELSPATVSVTPGATTTVSAVAKDSQGNMVTGQTFVWRSSDTAVATVVDGVVTGVASGTVTISASIGGVTSNGVALSVSPAVGAPTARSDELIDAALAAGDLDSETALSFKVFALFRDARLPARYKGDDSQQFESDVLEEVLARFETLSAANQAALGPYLRRPADVGSWAVPLVPATAAASGGRKSRLASRPTCNGPAEGWLAAGPALTGKARVWYDRNNPIDEARAVKVSNAIENQAWPKLIDTLGFLPPMDDTSSLGCHGGDGRLDVYIVHGTDFRGLTVPHIFTNPLRKQAPVFVLINGDYLEVEAAAVHELMHAIQWAYPMAASQDSYGWMRDAMANWAIDHVYGKTDQFEQSLADCYTSSPQLSLDDRSTGHCSRNGNTKRDYGAYLLFQYIANTSGPAYVKQVLAATTGLSDNIAIVDASLSGGLKKHWPAFAKTLWNQGPFAAPAAGFEQWDQLQKTPALAPDLPNKTVANLGAQSEDETPLDEKINNVSSKYYHFTFSDETTRSLMFHNSFYANFKQGQKVNVQALLLPEGPAGTAWVEEDWTEFEWIGLCRDLKQQRIAEMVIIVSSAEWGGTNPAVVASEKPKLMRNNIGCYGYEGKATRKFSHKSWSSGLTTVSFDAKFNFLPGTTPLQFTDAAEGRKRVPILAPQLTGGGLTYDETFVDNGCRYTANGSFAESSGPTGMAVGSITINYFNESLPTQMRLAQETLVGTAKRAYVAAGISKRILKGSVTGPQPDCGTEYETAAGQWLLTHEGSSPKPTVAANGHLLASFTASKPSDSFIEEYTWDLKPMREP
jgi:hypothetical protein